MEFDNIIQNLRKKIYHPVYLLQGEEPYFIDIITDHIEKNVLSDAEKGFNLTVFYGKDSDARTIAESALRFPMMASHHIIIVKEAQSLNNIENLALYAEKPLQSTILVLSYKYKTLDARKTLVKAIKKNGVIFTSEKVYENKIPEWIEKYLAQKEYSISPQAAQIITSYLGNDLGKIANELEKLMIAIKGTNKITPEHIEQNIGLSKEFNIYELQNALGTKNIYKANQIINYFGANQTANPIQKTISNLYFYFLKLFTYHFLTDKSERNVSVELHLHPFIAKSYIAAAKNYSPTKLYEIFGILREYDMKSKGSDVSTMVDSADLQKEMIYKILH